MMRLLGTTFFFLTSFSAFAQSLSCPLMPFILRKYLVDHVSLHSLNDSLKTQTVEQYIKGLDSFKVFLLEEDIKKTRNELKNVFETMKSGNCALLTQVQDTAVKRAEEIEKTARAFLGKDYKLDESAEFQMDPEKRKFPKDAKERDEFLKKYIHFQITNYLLSGTKLNEAKDLLIHRYELVTKRLRERKEDKQLAEFLKAFSAALDPHTTFFTADDLEEFKIDMRLSLEGIGASLSSQDGFTVVEEIIPGGAADKAKVLMPKDKIIAVGQEKSGGAKADPEPVPVIDMDLRDVVKLIRGKKGSHVKLTILRQSGTKQERLVVKITRDKIDLKEQAAKITFEKRKVGDRNLKLGIIELPSFYGEGESGKRSSYTDMAKLLKQAQKEKVDGLLLNLSRNGGGLLDDAVRIAGLFIKKGGIVATQNSQKNVEILADEDENVAYAGPLVILTSRLSASASEILAGSLKDYNRALVIGADHTFGKGTVQAVMPLPKDLGAMKITTGIFYIPGGQSTQHQGVSAHITLPSVLNNDEIGEKSLDNSLPPSKIERFVSQDTANSTKADQKWMALSDATIKTLVSASKERVAKEPKFQEILKDIEESKKNQGVIKLAEVKKRSEEEKKKNKDKDKKSTSEKIKDADAPQMRESLNVLTDLIVSETKAGATAKN